MLNDSLKAIIKSHITFQLGSTYLLTGDNGTGKTSFLKNILIPMIAKAADNNFLFFYAEQDIAIQFYIIRAYYKGLKNSSKEFTNFEVCLNNLKEEFLHFKLYKDKSIIFVLDEIEQYVNRDYFLQDLFQANIVLILVTHNPNAIRTSNKIINITFHRIESGLVTIGMH